MKLATTLSVAIVLALTNTIVLPLSVDAHNGEDDTEITQAPQTKPVQSTSATADYKYVAQPGDSYSLMARKAIQSHGIISKLTLDWGQILSAETNMTLAAGSPLLAQGQIVTISQSSVKAAADKAKALTPEQIKLWREYLPGVEFNTNNVGEDRN